jgi:hypothetical protein
VIPRTHRARAVERVIAVGASWALGAAVAGASTCDVNPVADGPWLSTVVAFEHFDAGRSHRFRCATFAGDADGANDVEAARIATNYPTPYNLTLGADGARYIYGGAYGDFPGAPGSFVAKIGADGKEAWRRRLFDAAAAPARWNYPGVAGLLRDGFLYAAYTDELAKIDPATGAVVSKIGLPSATAPEDTAYNGFNAFADGRLVMKSVHRAPGCAEQGFSAFLRCEGARDVAHSTIAVVNPETMRVLASIEAPEHLGGRLTTARYDGVDRLYVVGARSLYRYNWDGANLALDSAWGPVRYALPGQRPAPAVAILGDWVVLQTNAIPAKKPMSVVAVNQRDGRLVRLDPFEHVPPWEYTFGSKSFLPAMLSVDPENNRVYIADGGYGLVAGYGFNQATGKMRELWMEKQRTLNFSTLIGSREERVWVGTDVRGLCLFMRCLRSYKKEQIVLRNAATGKVIGRSPMLPKMTTGALVTPGNDGALYYLTLAGDIYEVTAAPKE